MTTDVKKAEALFNASIKGGESIMIAHGVHRGKKGRVFGYTILDRGMEGAKVVVTVQLDTSGMKVDVPVNEVE